MPNTSLTDEALQIRVRTLIASGELPTDAPSAIWGGAGRNDPCNICQFPIVATEISFDLLFSTSTGDIELRMHQRCHLSWEQERRIAPSLGEI